MHEKGVLAFHWNMEYYRRENNDTLMTIEMQAMLKSHQHQHPFSKGFIICSSSIHFVSNDPFFCLFFISNTSCLLCGFSLCRPLHQQLLHQMDHQQRARKATKVIIAGKWHLYWGKKWRSAVHSACVSRHRDTIIISRSDKKLTHIVHTVDTHKAFFWHIISQWGQFSLELFFFLLTICSWMLMFRWLSLWLWWPSSRAHLACKVIIAS